MNITEKKLSELVRRIVSRGHLVSIKAEFEAEGTRSDELLRLLDITRHCNVPLTLKIGGCEAVKDLYEARQFGARYSGTHDRIFICIEQVLRYYK